MVVIQRDRPIRLLIVGRGGTTAPRLTIAPAGRMVNEVETLNQFGMRSAVRR
jgi:hypothetical protein